MDRYQLVIDNQIADVFNGADVSVAISYMIANINSLEGSSNATSKTIKLPGTARNKKIFGFADDISVTDFKGQKVSLTATIREGGTDILPGVVNLKDVTRSGSGVVFNITVIGNSGQWVEFMKTSDLNGIDLGGAHTKTATYINAQSTTDPGIYGLVNNGFPGGHVVISSVEDDGNGYAKMIMEGTNAIINLRTNFAYGEIVMGYVFNNSAYNTLVTIQATQIGEDGRQYFTTLTRYMGDSSGILRAAKCNLAVEDRPLLINVRKTLLKIFDLAGYQISSAFTESAFFQKLYMLPGKEKRSPAWVAEKYTKMGTPGVISGGSIVTVDPFPFTRVIDNDAGLWSASTNRFTATEAMHGIFRVSFNIKGTTDYEVQARFNVYNSAGTYYASYFNRPTTIVTLDELNYQVLTQEAEIRLQAGDYFTVQLSFSVMGGEYIDSYTVSNDETFLECEITDKIIKGSAIAPGEFLPAVKQIEFVKALRHAFNLYFFTDVAMKTVYIEPRNTFYKSDKYLDLSEKLDVSKDIVFEELGSDLTKSIAFKYKTDGSDQGVKDWEKANNTRYSTYVASILNRFAGDGETAVENPLFAPTVMAPFPAAGLTTMLPKIWQELPAGDTYPEFLDEFTPRLLYYAGSRACLSGETWKFEGVTQSSYPLFCSNDIETGNDNSLLFDPAALDLELYRKHYENYIRTLNEGRKITAYFKLSASDIQALMTPDASGTIIKDFRSQVFFRHKGEVIHCRLDSVVDYKPGVTETTKVILVTDVDNTFNTFQANYSKLEFTSNTLVMPAAYASGSVYLNSFSWADVHDRLTGQFVTQNAVQHGIGAMGGYGGSPYTIERGFLFFNTAMIPDSAVIHQAYLDIYKISGHTDQEVTLFAGTQANVLTSADYQKFGSVPFGETSHGVLGFRRIYLNDAGIAAINKTGYTKFCLRETHFDVGNTPPAANYPTFRTHFVNAPATYINKLTVKWL